MEELLRIREMCKAFPGVQANDHISLDVRSGEVLALLGENGAGKTTLMNCVFGMIKPDRGQIFWKGQPVEIHDSHAAVDLGIGMVHQHFMLVPVLSVVENVSLGLPSSRGLLLDNDVIEKRINALSQEFGLDVDPRAIIWQLPVGTQQRVEILKALYRNINLIILDEPTAVLTPKEVNDLFTVIKRLTAKGMGVILITHKLDEVMTVSDRVTVLRDGKVIDTVKTSTTNTQELARMMVGREVIFNVEKPPLRVGKAVMEARHLKAVGDRGNLALNDVSFDLHEGEILGVAGVDGNGQLELEEVLTGLRLLTEGQILVNGKNVSGSSPAEFFNMGVAHIASDRLDRAVAVKLNVEENLIASSIRTPPYSKRGIINYPAIHHHAVESIKEFNIQTNTYKSLVSTLSGETCSASSLRQHWGMIQRS